MHSLAVLTLLYHHHEFYEHIQFFIKNCKLYGFGIKSLNHASSSLFLSTSHLLYLQAFLFVAYSNLQGMLNGILVCPLGCVVLKI